MLVLAYLINITVFLLVAWRVTRTGTTSLFNPLFWYLVFHLLVFIVRPAVVIWADFSSVFHYMRFAPSDSDCCRALLAATVGLASIAIGFYSVASKVEYKFPKLLALPRVFKWVYLVFTAFAVPLIAFSVHSVSGGVQGEQVGGTYILVGTSGYIVDAQLMALPLCLLFIVFTRFSWLSYLPLLAYVTTAIVFGRVRWVLVVSGIATYLLYVSFKSKRFSPITAICMFSLIAIIFWAKGLSREIFVDLFGGAGKQSSLVFDTTVSMREKLDTQDFANFDYLTYIVANVPEQTRTYTYFTQWAQIFTEPIPRTIWANKPIGAPIKYYDLNDYGNFVGLTPSLVGDGWQSLGWCGVILTCALVGAVLGKVHVLAATRSADPMVACAYILFLGLSIQLYRDGGISILKFLLFTVGPIILMRVFIGTFFPRSLPHESDYYWRK